MQCPIDGGLQLLGRAWLRQELMNQTDNLVGLVLLDLTGKHDSCRLRVAHPHQLAQCRTVDTRHLSIADNYVSAGLFEVVERSLAVFGKRHLPVRVCRAHSPTDSAQNPFVIVNKENVCHSKPVRRRFLTPQPVALADTT